MRRWLPTLAILIAAAPLLLRPAGASASFVVRASTQRLVFFAGNGCGSTSSETLQLPRGAFDIRPVTLPTNTVLHSLDDDETEVARITSVATNARAQNVQWTATASDEMCPDPLAEPADQWDAEPALEWETSGDDIQANYSRRISRVYLPATCSGPRYRPRHVIIACGDANLQLAALQWKGWNGRNATARGTALMNDCVPYCAAGHFRRFPVAVTASQPASCRGVYQYLHLRYRLVRPQRGFSRTGRTSFAYTCEAA